jgi:hypothetical protein
MPESSPNWRSHRDSVYTVTFSDREKTYDPVNVDTLDMLQKFAAGDRWNCDVPWVGYVKPLNKIP